MPDLTVPASSLVPTQYSTGPHPHQGPTHESDSRTATGSSRSPEQQVAALRAAINWRKKLTSERESEAQKKLLTSLEAVVKPQTGDNGEPKLPSVPDSEGLTALYRGGLLSRHQFIAGLKIWASFDKGPKGREGLETLLSEQRIRYRDYPDEREIILADLARFDDNLDLSQERKNAAAVCRAILQQSDAGMLGLYRFSTEPAERERFLTFLQSVIDDETIAQQDRESIRIERDSITRLHALTHDMAEVTSDPGPGGDAALNALLDRYETEYKAVSTPADREFMLAELRYLAGDDSLSESRRATVLARRTDLQGDTLRILDAYRTAADPSERRLQLAALRSLLDSNTLSKMERKHVVDEMRRINAARLLATFNPNKPFEASTDPRYTGLRDAVMKAMESYFREAVVVFGHKMPLCGKTRWSDIAPIGVSLVTAGLAAYKAPSLEGTLPRPVAALGGFNGSLLAISVVQQIAQEIELSGYERRIENAYWLKMKDSGGIDRTPEVIEMFERARRDLFPGEEEAVRWEMVGKQLFETIGRHPELTTNLADFVINHDYELPTQALDWLISLSRHFDSVIDAAQPDGRQKFWSLAQECLEKRRLDTVDALEKILADRKENEEVKGDKGEDDKGEVDELWLLNNDPKVREEVRAALNGREPLHTHDTIIALMLFRETGKRNAEAKRERTTGRTTLNKLREGTYFDVNEIRDPKKIEDWLDQEIRKSREAFR